MKKILCFFLLCLLSLQSIKAQNDSLVPQNIALKDTIQKESVWNRFKYDINSMSKGFVYAYGRPLHWEKDDYLILGATAVGTGVLFLTDKHTATYFENQGEGVPNGVKDFGYNFGKPLFNYGVTGGIYFYGLLTNNEKVRYTGVLMITSASVGGLIQQVLKTATGRARPSTGIGHDSFRPFDGSQAFSSFPSGHTVLAVTTFYAISKQFKNPWMKASCYLVGSITPLSRLWDNKHWASDVFLSTVMSVAIVESVDSFFKKQKRYNLNPEMSKKISWNLRVGYNQIGVVGAF